MELDGKALLDLLEARTVADLYARTKPIVRSLGFDHFLYGARLHLGGPAAHQLVISGYPPAWRQLYEQENYEAIDPTVAHCLTSSLPLVWSEQLFRDKNALAIMEAARRFGVRSGITVPVHSVHKHTSLLSVACDAAEEEAQFPASRIAQVQLLANYLHEAARVVIERKERVQGSVCQLTPRETQCLTWAAAGKSSWEIARIVSASERTVNFHIGNAMEKLDVSSRSHAVAKALACSLISV